MKRRSFLALGGAVTAGMPQLIAVEEVPRKNLRVGVIGHTGRGDHGHALDTVWSRIKGADVVGVADPDEAYLAYMALA